MFQIKIILCHSSNVTLTILTVFGLEAVTVLICMRTLFSWMEKDFLTEDLKETSGTFSQWVNRGAAAMYTIRKNKCFLNTEACKPIQADLLIQFRT